MQIERINMRIERINMKTLQGSGSKVLAGGGGKGWEWMWELV